MTDSETMVLWRPCGPSELALVRESGWSAWPPRLPEQPIFYPVLNEDYAAKIARDWNAPRDGVGYVTRFEVDRAFAERYPVQQAGGSTILELWVPSEELEQFNRHIIGPIEVVAEYRVKTPKAETGKPRDNEMARTARSGHF
ncbi:ADP-ribosylation/crystallin J1 [Glycomyces mayteni]|uniref:ADP-ribosylation/crystallin J1 n=1 Tax=Glycomyces mayteni TaxID=543887 RepID=A0ABW2DHV6_9ACTN|nr:hypothetical protein GCM10025732_57820 [Glycomyces mayteni]